MNLLNQKKHLFISDKTTIEYSFYTSKDFHSLAWNFLDKKDIPSFFLTLSNHINIHASFIFIHYIYTQPEFRKQHFASNAIKNFKNTFFIEYPVVLFSDNFHQDFNLLSWYAKSLQFLPIFESIDSTAFILP